MADDWSYAWQGIHHDLLPWLRSEYLHWNGRYFSNILVGRGPLVLGLDHLWLYRLIPVALILGSLLSAWMLLSSFTSGHLNTSRRGIAALILVALFLHGMPDIGQGIYWYTGAITYQLGNILLFTYVAILVRLLLRGGGMSWPIGAGMIALAALVIGSSEVHMVLMVAFHAAWVMGRARSAVPWPRGTIVLLGCVAAFSLVVALAPGNTVRGSNFPLRHDLLNALWMSLLQTGRFGLTWAGDLSLLLASLLFLPLSRDLSRRVPLFQRSFGLTPFRSTLLLAAVIFLCVFPAYWATGILGQHRTVNVAYWCFLPLWFINLTVWDAHVLQGRWRFDLKPRWRLLAGIAMTMHLHLGRNGGGAWLDLVDGTAARFNAQMQARYVTLTDPPRSDGPVPLDPITAVPRTLYLLEIQADPTHWLNRAYGLYFGLGDRPVVPAPAAH